MEILRLLKELDDLIMAQKTVLGVTCNFHQEDFLALTNKVRLTLLPGALSTELTMGKVANVLARHFRSEEELASVMKEIQSVVNA